MPHHDNSMASGTARIALDLTKNSVILSNITVIRSTVDQEDLKPYWKSEQKQQFSRWSTGLLFASKTTQTTEKRIE